MLVPGIGYSQGIRVVEDFGNKTFQMWYPPNDMLGIPQLSGSRSYHKKRTKWQALKSPLRKLWRRHYREPGGQSDAHPSIDDIKQMFIRYLEDTGFVSPSAVDSATVSRTPRATGAVCLQD